MAIHSLQNIPGGEFNATLVEKLVDDLFNFADTEEYTIRMQLTINTLMQYDIIKYMDDTSIPCDTANELFDEDIRQLEPRVTIREDQPDECEDDIDAYDVDEDYFADEEYFGNDDGGEEDYEGDEEDSDANINDLFDEIMNPSDIETRIVDGSIPF